MNADARHGGLRPKRCLPAKFHPKTAHHYRLNLKVRTTRFPRTDSCFKFPKSRRTIITAPKRANSRFFTIVTPSLPYSCPRLTKLGRGQAQLWRSYLTTKHIINHLISVVW